MPRKILFTISAVVLAIILIYPQQDKSPNYPDKKIPSGERDFWDLQFSFNLNTSTGAAGNAGAECDGTYLYTTRWASNLIHKFDNQGNLLEEFSIPGVSGLRDLAFDGTYMYGGAAGNLIYQMDFNTRTLIGTISSPVAVRFIAYDEVNDGFWCGTWADNPTLVSRNGTILNTITTGLSSQYGAAVDNVSAGGPYLWMFDQGTGACPGSLMIIQYDIASGTATGVAHDACEDLTDGIAGGLFFTTNFISGTCSIGGVMQSNSGLDDTFFIYDICGYPIPCFVGSSDPNPINGANEVSVYLDQITWANYGDSAISNKLYFGTDPGNLSLVQSGTLATSWNISPSPMNYYTTYYWKVLEICNAGYCTDCPTRYFITEEDSTLVSVTENFYPLSADYWTGTTDGANKTDVSEVRGHNTEDGWFMFDISSIPPDAIIDSARFYGYVNYTYYPYWSATPLPGLNPLTATANQLETAITNNSGQGIAYIYSNEPSTFATGWHNYLLGTTAIADIQNATSQGWFAMGMDSRDNSITYYINWDGWAQSNIPYLRLTYHYPCCGRFTDNFDSYTVGQQLACQNPNDWTTWNIMPCSPVEDPYITTNYAWSGENSFVILPDNSLIKLLGGLTTGDWYISFLFYIPEYKEGYFNVLADFNMPNPIRGMECYFDQGGGARLLNGGTANFTWQPETWQQIIVHLNLDQDYAEMLIGENDPLTTIAFWQWTGGGTVPLKLDAINFFGATVLSEMYVDNFYFGTSEPILIPVELKSFTADVNDRNVFLRWQTATELNNRGFEVQRSVSKDSFGEIRSQMSEWGVIGFVEGGGTTTKPKSYSFTDRNVLPGKYSYRLKQIDFDGSFEYSKNIEVEVTEPLKFLLEQNYPNPFNPVTLIKYSIPEDGNVSIKVYNILGQQATELVNGFMKAGNYELTFDAAGLATGVYFYILKSGKNVSVKKLVLIK